MFRLIHRYIKEIIIKNKVYNDWRTSIFKKRFEKNTAYNIIDRNQQKAEYPFAIFQKEENVTFSNPTILPNTHLPYQMEYYAGKSFKLEERFITVFERAYLIGQFAIGLTNKNEILLETTHGSYLTLQNSSPEQFKKQASGSVEKKIKCGISLVHIFDYAAYKNYFHWTIESLLLLQAIAPFIDKYGVKPTLLLNDEPKPYQLQALKSLGFHSKDIVLWKFNKVLVERLIVPSIARNKTQLNDIISLGAMNWLKGAMLVDDMSTGLPTRIYISRNKSQFRRILNEEELMASIKPLGFQRVYLEDFSFLQQVALFNNAEYIISPHGAGLVNLIYCNSNVNVLEIIGEVEKTDQYTHFFMIACSKGIDYSFLEAEETVTVQEQIGQRYDMIVNCKEVLSLLYTTLNEI